MVQSEDREPLSSTNGTAPRADQPCEEPAAPERIAHSATQRRPVFPHRRDAIVVLAVVVASYGVCGYYNLAEALRHLTQPYEDLQLDELPVVMLVAAVAMGWFAWRRLRETRRELTLRRSAEARLATTLAENRRLTRRHIEIQEAERRRLARELHDELGQYLNAMKLDAVALSTPPLPPSLRGRAQSILATVDHIHRIVQALIRRFRPVALDELGLSAALEHTSDTWRRQLPNIQIKLQIHGDVDTLVESLNLAIYRIVQESLTNISRHADANRVDIRLTRHGRGRARDAISLLVADDGRGCPQPDSSSGVGLVGMRERAQMFNGVLRIRTAPKRGFKIWVRLPVQHRPQQAATAVTPGIKPGMGPGMAP